ncbi:fumarylacetoacetate hydrolase family protein [Pseudonocardia eucalypti]|uniref:Fumarylacetoacetate hydrolase family protein n=1 Tax=Pseudonocardia eucalypti TaxID=648755 RepID=A0ABP9QXC5_9PSEU|nr:2-keto-4-pentenoate hydratase/2-oxohepta-3-ene-1,7-dioic acid hydratase in catechol pathway [Pseudonocardia eucalypti]
MRWVTYSTGSDSDQRVGVLQDGQVHGRRGSASLAQLVAGGHEELAAIGRAVLRDPVEVVDVADVTLAAPIPVPPSIRDFMAFESHAVTAVEAVGQKLSPVWYEIPAFYFSNPAAVHSASAEVSIPPMTKAFDYELEVGVVIGRPGGDIPVAHAASHIAGFVLLCDWSARDVQGHELAVGLGPAKGKDSATTFGPWLATPDELDPYRVGKGFDRAMTASVNGVRYSTGNLADLFWSFEEMISYASRGTRLVRGDVLGSGTVGTGCILELSRVHGLDQYPYLVSGDRVHLTVEGLGSIDVSVAGGA